MSRFSAQDLDEIKARNPLADIAGGYVQLRRAGGRLAGPCPICGGRAALNGLRYSMMASWGCAVCPDGGDVIRLVQLVEGCDFRTAIERLGGRSTVDADAAKRLFNAREENALREKRKTRNTARRSASGSGNYGHRHFDYGTAAIAISRDAIYLCRRIAQACVIFPMELIGTVRPLTSVAGNLRARCTRGLQCWLRLFGQTVTSAACT